MKISLLFNCTDHFLSKEVFKIAGCTDCGFIFTQDHPGDAEIGRYYDSEEYISHSDTKKGITNKLYHIGRDLMLNRKIRIVKSSTGLKKGSLLDIGSGTGHFINSVRNHGWLVKGIEVNEKAREYSIRNFNLDITGPEKIAALPQESFDCITLWHVLEHFQNPNQYLSEINRLLKPGAICLLALPNCKSYDAVYYGEYWAAFDVPRHLWHFNPVSFRRLSGISGFRLLSLKNLPLDVFYISSLSEKYKGSKSSFLKGMIIGSWFSLLSLLNIERSSSLIYILKKKQ